MESHATASDPPKEGGANKSNTFGSVSEMLRPKRTRAEKAILKK